MHLKNEFHSEGNKIINSAWEAVSKISKNDTERYLRQFQEVGFLQIPSFVDDSTLAEFYDCIIKNAFKYFVTFERAESKYFNRSIIGYKFKRLFLEPKNIEEQKFLESDENWLRISSQLKFIALQLSEIIQPIINSISSNFKYKSGNIFYYGEGDFIGLHSDAQFFDRINAQFPLSINSTGCIRIQYKDKLKAFYDEPGCLNLLGPKTYHDVPPLLKNFSVEKAARINLTLRYME